MSNSSYNSQQISTKHLHNVPHQVFQCILSTFCNSITSVRKMALCTFLTLTLTIFCAQLLLQFSTDFNETSTQCSPSNVPAHIVIFLRFDYFFRNYGPLFISNRNPNPDYLLFVTPPTILNRLQRNIYTMFPIKCSSTVLKSFNDFVKSQRTK